MHGAVRSVMPVQQLRQLGAIVDIALHRLDPVDRCDLFRIADDRRGGFAPLNMRTF